MIQNIRNNNETQVPNDSQMAILKEHFPNCFNKDGFFDLERFKGEISDKTDVLNEGYELRFLGKSYAKLLASTDTTTVIQPDEIHNSKSENQCSENIYVSGDNLDGLKHLLKSYQRKIKCIYIDPPYNTGSDGFVYQDKFQYTKEILEKKLSISEEEAERILDLTRRGSGSHSAWLMFMYCRLLLARDLLTDDGVIFISIDDNEISNLKLLCDDVFGEENFLANLIWKRRTSSALSDNNVSTDHEYVVAYMKHSLKEFAGIQKDFKGYLNPDNDPRGPWVLGDLTVGMTASMRPNQAYNLVDPKNGNSFSFNPNRVWAYIPDSMQKLIDEKRVYFPDDITKRPMLKRFQGELKSLFNPLSSLIIDQVGLNTEATRTIQEVLGSNVFDYSKPLSLLNTLISQVTKNSDIILDFFSGSATTAHAVMQLNAHDQGNRRFIAIQLPEKLAKENASQAVAYEFLSKNNYPNTLNFIGIERIKRAAKKIKEKYPEKEFDLGFKHYTLVEPNQNTLDKLETFDKSALIVDTNIIDDFGKPTILSTWLNADGYGLTSHAQKIDLAGYTAYYYKKHLYFIDAGFNLDSMKALLSKYDSEGNFNPENLVLFGYSFPDWSINEMVEKNLRVINDSEKNLKINLAVRY